MLPRIFWSIVLGLVVTFTFKNKTQLLHREILADDITTSPVKIAPAFGGVNRKVVQVVSPRLKHVGLFPARNTMAADIETSPVDVFLSIGYTIYNWKIYFPL